MNQNRKQKSIADILGQPKNELADLINRVNALNELNRHLYTILDKKLSKHCQVANFGNGALILAVDDSNWATRIRYMIPNLIKQLKQQPLFHELKSIKCIISPNLTSVMDKETVI